MTIEKYVYFTDRAETEKHVRATSKDFQTVFDMLPYTPIIGGQSVPCLPAGRVTFARTETTVKLLTENKIMIAEYDSVTGQVTWIMDEMIDEVSSFADHIRASGPEWISNQQQAICDNIAQRFPEKE